MLEVIAKFALGAGVVSITILALSPVDAIIERADGGFAHLLAFTYLSFVGLLALPRVHWLWIALSCVIFGAGIEIIQATLVQGRTSDPMDFASDVVATCVGLLGGGLARRWAISRR